MKTTLFRRFVLALSLMLSAVCCQLTSAPPPLSQKELGLSPTNLYSQVAPPTAVVSSAVAREPSDRTSGCALPVGLSNAHLAALNRRRRIYVNNDAGMCATVPPPTIRNG
jgi:hypothetical protein